MSNRQNGFTIIELFIACIIVGLLISIISFIAKGPNTNSLVDGDPACDIYRDYSLKDVPARCVNYYENGK